MKKLAILLVPFIFVACDSVTERTIYSKYDPEWKLVADMQAKQCIEKSAILKKIAKYSDFSLTPFSVGDIFRIHQDTDNTKTIYVRVNSITATEMVFEYNNVDDDYDKVAVFTKTEYLKLQSVFEDILCDPKYKSNFTVSAAGNFRWDKYKVIKPDDDNDNVDEAFIDQRDNLKIDPNLPLFFYYYNGTKTLKKIAEVGAEEINSTSKITITNGAITETCIDGIEPCVFTNTTTSNCTIAIEESAIDNKTPTANFLSASDCPLLVSNSK